MSVHNRNNKKKKLGECDAAEREKPVRKQSDRERNSSIHQHGETESKKQEQHKRVVMSLRATETSEHC